MGSRWFVVHTQPRREVRALLHLSEQRFEVFLPRLRKTVRHARQFRSVTAPLFPRYLFISLDLERDRWRSVNGTCGVSHLIMEGERPKPIGSDVVDNLMRASGADGVLPGDPDVRPGARVRLSSGPFSGLVGTLLDLDPNGRVRVLLDVMGGKVPVMADGAGLVSAT